MSEKDTPIQEEQLASGDDASATDASGDADSSSNLQRQVEELKDKNLRLLAELRNSQQRALREKAEALKHAEADFARDLLMVYDDLERVLNSSAPASSPSQVLEGVRIVADHLLKIFKDHHIEPIEAAGKPFDPEFHEAMLQQPSADAPPGTVLQELARGFRMHGRVIRSTKVIVSRAADAAEPS